ncbi:MAG: hypothetical protein IIB59_05090, partial [Planctomycetes bacterium]|nr:hypothetical protein [Planctomycetota bacterium]
MPATPPGVHNASRQTRPLPQPPLCVSCIPRGLRGLPAALNNRDQRGSLPIVEEQAKPKVSPFRVTLRRFLRARITAGLIFVLPLWIAFLLVKFVFEVMRDTSLWVVESYLQSVWGERFLETWGVTAPDLAERGLEILPGNVQWGISIFSVLLTILFLYLVGLFTANIISRPSEFLSSNESAFALTFRLRKHTSARRRSVNITRRIEAIGIIGTVCFDDSAPSFTMLLINTTPRSNCSASTVTARLLILSKCGYRDHSGLEISSPLTRSSICSAKSISTVP